jgi:4-amino-4-deoxy-L-arabinose transferase-like glycosyltransferase
VKWRGSSVIMLLVLVALLAIPRLVGIDRFATIDEPYWLTAGSDFYYALGQRDFADTVYDYHPAVTTMWIVTGAMLLYFPQYRGMGQGYFDVYKDSLDTFLLAHGRSPLGLLTTARVLQIVIIVLLLLSVFWYLRLLLGGAIAVAATLLVSFDPFFLGHSRLLNHEGLMSLFVIISLLSLLASLFVDDKWVHLIVSGVAAGAAQLTKSSSIVLVPVILIAFAAHLWSSRQTGWLRALRGTLVAFGIWLASMVVVYVLFWPGMWVAPGKMLYEVFGNAFSYATEGSRLSVAAAAPVAFQPKLVDVWLYVQSVLWRTTPVVWIGGLLALFPLVRETRERRLVLLCLVLIAALFVLLFGLASGRNSAHYVLTSYVALDVLAAAGFATFAGLLLGKRGQAWGRMLSISVVGVAVLIQAVSALQFFPYYYTYYDPIMEAREPGLQDPNFGYGEGLDLAAAYLAGKDGASSSTAMAFYGRGPFSYFYPGKTEPLKTVYADAENIPQLQQILSKSSYLVIYYALEKGRNSPPNVMRALEGIKPEKSIWLDGIEYVRIYSLASMPADFLDRLWP